MPEMETARLGLPLLQAAQAQKHVTLNESLLRLDGLVNLVLQQAARTTPPGAAADGLCWGVGRGAVNAWEGHDGEIAIASDGGWIFVHPRAGMRAHDAASGRPLIHDGEDWIAGALTLGPSGTGMIAGLAEGEVAITPGTEVVSTVTVPAGVMLVGATARVREAITGSVSTWSLGTQGAPDRFGTGLGTGAGSWARGILSAPMTYWEAQPLRLTAQGGSFAGGRVRLALHWWELRLPA
ncbi:DUF2793 domain-containing protein [Paracoccus sp. S-4012]|uniref:DUF2793 domain-containing protein n=1 Tax=Paracoccus sp. S-4012 TaxID=2665648 RepID=UPI0012AF1D80|nr:DUF2793 domain-containing protein [Paracoccus sp. S-4012]MRX50694.1 DUF2793 domain-containing protein [Paracoccus sp. S-4012]